MHIGVRYGKANCSELIYVAADGPVARVPELTSVLPLFLL